MQVLEQITTWRAAAGCRGLGISLLAWAVVVCATAACAAAPQVPQAAAHAEETSMAESIQLNVPFRLSPGTSAGWNDGQVTVGFDTVSNDSRCPKDVQCMWEGDAEVAVWLQVGGGERRDAVLHVTRDPKILEAEGYRLVLQGLEPYPVSTEKIALEDYVALLEVQR